MSPNDPARPDYGAPRSTPRTLLGEYIVWLTIELELAEAEWSRVPEAERPPLDIAGPGAGWQEKHIHDGLDRPSARAPLVLGALGCRWEA